MLKIYILIAVVGLVGGVVYGGYYYYKDTQSRIQTLTENNVMLEGVAEEQGNTIDVLVKDQQKFEELNRELQSKLDQANEIHADCNYSQQCPDLSLPCDSEAQSNVLLINWLLRQGIQTKRMLKVDHLSQRYQLTKA